MINKFKFRIGWALLSVLIIYDVCFSFAYGFRYPSDYVMTSHTPSYLYGFLPRGLIPEIGRIIFGDSWYSRKVLSTVIMVVGISFLIWFVYETLINMAGQKNIWMYIVLLYFANSPFAKYYMHEMGYFEQYGYLLIIIALYLCMGQSTRNILIVPEIRVGGIFKKKE